MKDSLRTFGERSKVSSYSSISSPLCSQLDSCSLLDSALVVSLPPPVCVEFIKFLSDFYQIFKKRKANLSIVCEETWRSLEALFRAMKTNRLRRTDSEEELSNKCSMEIVGASNLKARC